MGVQYPEGLSAAHGTLGWLQHAGRGSLTAKYWLLISPLFSLSSNRTAISFCAET